jgi:Fe-S oxidoreductase
VKGSETLRADAPRIAVYVDCFTGFNEPGIGLAACRVLQAFGYKVELLDAGCCGRAQISMGLLESAIDTADATLARLKHAIDDPEVRAIVVCEPSCLSAWKDDWLQLKLRTPMDVRTRLASKSWLVEEFLEKNWEKHPQRPDFASAHNSEPHSDEAQSEPVLLHGHCHQKALWGVDSSAAFLRRIVGPRLRVLDTGCCGMAGSFGYDEKKYDLSMKIGELTLFPAVREARAKSEGVAVIAPGTSCRHQILDGTRVHAIHPIELADRLINPR